MGGTSEQAGGVAEEIPHDGAVHDSVDFPEPELRAGNAEDFIIEHEIVLRQ